MMDEMMKQLMAKKGASDKMSPEDAQAKLDVIKELLEMASSAMAGKVKGGMDEMQKVSVMAPDQDSLLAGLDKAKDIASDGDGSDEGSSDPALESAEEKTGMDLDNDGEEGESADHISKIEDIAKKKKRPLFSMMDDEDDNSY